MVHVPRSRSVIRYEFMVRLSFRSRSVTQDCYSWLVTCRLILPAGSQVDELRLRYELRSHLLVAFCILVPRLFVTVCYGYVITLSLVIVRVIVTQLCPRPVPQIVVTITPVVTR